MAGRGDAGRGVRAKSPLSMARRPTPLSPSPTPRGAGSARLEAALREQQRRITAALDGLGEASADDVHGARVAARRLRSMLKTFRPMLDERRARTDRARLRAFARMLGTAREADVRRDLLLALAEADPSIGPAERRRLKVLIDDACLASREQLARLRVQPDWIRLRRALQRSAANDRLLKLRDAELGELVRLAAQAWRRPVKLLRRRPASTEELHELRLAFKHCRYALEPIADVAPRKTARLLRRLRAAQDRIGEHRDTLLAEHWVREHERALGRALVAKLVARMQQREETLRRRSATRAAKVLDAWRDWRDATRRVRKAATPGRA